MKIRIGVTHLLSAIVLVACLDISYVNMSINGINTLLFALRVLLIISLIMWNIYLKRKCSHEMWIIAGLFAWIVCISIYHNIGIVSVIRPLSIPFLAALYIDQHRNSPSLVKVLSSWRVILLILVIIDLMTMVLYPSGLYRDSVYSLNWFLGYKTLRLVYLLPLCIFEGYLSNLLKGKLCFRSYCIFTVSIISLLYSQATSASACLGLVCLLIIGLNYVQKIKIFEKLIKWVCNYKIILPVYGVVVFLTVILPNSSFIQTIITQVFHKDATLTTRTILWAQCLELIRTHWIGGIGYLSVGQYQDLMNSVYYSSPHNMVLSVLISGSIIGLVLYILLTIISWKKLKHRKDNLGSIVSFGLIGNFLVGITSSIIVFSFCGFMFFILMNAKPYETQEIYSKIRK